MIQFADILKLNIIFAAILTNKDLIEDLNVNLDKLLPKLMEITPAESANLPVIIKRLKEYYLNGSSIIKQSNDQGFLNVSCIVCLINTKLSDMRTTYSNPQMYTHRAFHYPFYKAIENYVKYADIAKNPVYLVKFAYKGSLSYSKFFTGSDRDFGVGHIDDLIYLFKSPVLYREFASGSDSAQMIQTLVATYVEFAKHGYVKRFFSITLQNCTNNNKKCVHRLKYLNKLIALLITGGR